MPQVPRSVLITRPQPGAGETATRVARLGWLPVLSPALRIEAVPLRLPPAAALAAVLVASGNAIPALPPSHHALPLLATGDATAARARAAGFRDVRSAARDARALVALVQRQFSPHEGVLLLAAGRGQSTELAAWLREAGYRVIRRAVYAALPEPDLAPAAATAITHHEVCAALFFSAETASQFVRQVRRAQLSGALATVDAISIGQPAGMALQALPWRRIRVAAKPTQDEMLALLND